MTSPDILVVGGGPAGAATATWAARSGLRVLLVERARFPRHKACAEYLSPEASRDLHDLGVLGEVEAAGAEKLTGFRLVSDDGRSITGHFAEAPGYPPYRPYGLALPRAVLDPIVLSAAGRAGAEVRMEVGLEELILERGVVRGAVLRSSSGREVITPRAVVGADGLNSVVARQLGLARRRPPARLALVAHLDGVEGRSNTGEMFAGKGRYLGLARIGRELTNVAAVVPAREAPAIAADRHAFFWKELGRYPELHERTGSARIVREVMVTGPFGRRARRATHDGALLVGDAADFFDPFTGEGMFAALRGGRLAARALEAALNAGPATRAALLPYERARRRAFVGKWVLERVVALGAVQPRLMRRFTARLGAHPDIASLWVGAAGDTVPVRALFAPRALAALIA